MLRSTSRWPETPSQTAGPYVHIGCMPSVAGLEGGFPDEIGRSSYREGAKGERITISGSVLDGTGWAIRDAMLESWQADGAGIYPGQTGADPNVSGFCRFSVDMETGEYAFDTIKPGPVPTRAGSKMAPHISLWIVARGINIGLSTRIYFEDEDNSADPLLARVEQRQRVKTLIARKSAEGNYRFDIRLQGEEETVFLDL